MFKIKRLSVNDIRLFKDTVIRFIYESTTNASYLDSFVKADAEQKFDELDNYLSQDKAIVYGAIEDNTLIGFVWAYEHPFRDDKSRIYVSILHIDAQNRSRKIGQYLLSKIEEEATSLGYGSVFLHIESFNDGAIRFYNKMGYVPERIQMVKKQLTT